MIILLTNSYDHFCPQRNCAILSPLHHSTCSFVFSVIDAALAVAGKVAEHANLYLRRVTELDAMLRIQGMLGSAFDVVKPSRKLIKVKKTTDRASIDGVK